MDVYVFVLIYSLEARSLPKPRTRFLSKSGSSKAQQPFCLCPTWSWGYRHMWVSDLLRGCWDLNSCLPDCTAFLTTKSSLQLPSFLFKLWSLTEHSQYCMSWAEHAGMCPPPKQFSVWICITFPHNSPMLSLLKKDIALETSAMLFLLVLKNGPFSTLVSWSCFFGFTHTKIQTHYIWLRKPEWLWHV